MKLKQILIAIPLWIIEYFIIFGIGSLPFGQAIVDISYPLASVYLFVFILLCRITWKYLGKLLTHKKNKINISNEITKLHTRIEKLKNNILFLENSHTDNLVIEKSKADLRNLNEEYNKKTNEIFISSYKKFRESLISRNIRKLNISNITAKYEKLKNTFLKKYYKNDTDEIIVVKLCNSDFSYLSAELVKIQNELLINSLSENELINKLKDIKNFMDYSEERKHKWICPKCHCTISSYPCKCCSFTESPDGN